MNFGLASDTLEIWGNTKYVLYGLINGEENKSLLLKEKTADRFYFYKSSEDLIQDMVSYFYLHKDWKGMESLEEAVGLWTSRSDVEILKFQLSGEGEEVKGTADIQIGKFLVIEGVHLDAEENNPILTFPVEGAVEMDPISREILKRKMVLAWANAKLMTIETPDMDIKIIPIVNGIRKASVNIDIGGVTLKNIEVRQGKYGLFVAFPSVRTHDGWKRSVFFKTQPAEDKVKAEILAAYRQTIEKREPGYARCEKSL